MTITNHGTFTLYAPVLPARPVEPASPAYPDPVTADATTEQIAAYNDAVAMATVSHQTALLAWRDACAPIDKLKHLLDARFVFARRADGADWYDINHQLPSGHYAIVVGSVVTAVSDDPTAFGIVDGMTLIEAPTPMTVGWCYDGAALTAPDSMLTASDLAAYAASKRYDVLVHGVPFGGQRIPGDDIAQGRLATASDNLATGALTEPLTIVLGLAVFTATLAEITALRVGLAQLTQAAFVVQGQVVTAINAGTITTPAQIDVAFAPMLAD